MMKSLINLQTRDQSVREKELFVQSNVYEYVTRDADKFHNDLKNDTEDSTNFKYTEFECEKETEDEVTRVRELIGHLNWLTTQDQI